MQGPRGLHLSYVNTINNLTSVKHQHIGDYACVHCLECVLALLTNTQLVLQRVPLSIRCTCGHFALDFLCVLTHTKKWQSDERAQAYHIVDGLACRSPNTNNVLKCVWLNTSPTCTHKHRCSPLLASLSSHARTKGSAIVSRGIGVEIHRHRSFIDPGREVCMPVHPQPSYRATLMSS